MCRNTVSLLVLALVMAAASALPTEAETTRVSLASDGAEGEDASWSPSISADGSLVAFSSIAPNLVAGDTNGVIDVFLHDRLTGATSRISLAADGSQGNAASYWPAISANGRYVAFQSVATNLVGGDTNGNTDVFVYDRLAGPSAEATTRVSVGMKGSQANAGSGSPAISADGRYVAFESYASNLVPGDTNGVLDVFLRDRLTGVTTRVSVGRNGSQANGISLSPAISADGRYVAFYSSASNLVVGDTNRAGDIFLHDRLTAGISRISVADDGAQANGYSYYPAISADGRFVAFASSASNLVPADTNGAIDIFIRDRLATGLGGTTTRVSICTDGAQGDAHSFAPALSADGRYVAFDSVASNFWPGDANGAGDIFVHDRFAGVTTRVSVASDGSDGDDDSMSPALAAGGRFVAFDSFADNLVPEDENWARDVFVTDLSSILGGGR